MVLWLDLEQKSDVLALMFTKFLCLVLLGPAETSLMLWLHENGFIKRAAFLALADALHKNN